MNGFLATAVIAGAFALIAKLIIDYAGPSRKAEKLGKHAAKS